MEKASAAGLDHEEPGWIFFGDDLKKAVEAGKVPMTEIDDHVHRILWAMFATGVIDDPPQKSVVDAVGGLEVAQKIAEQSTVLLKSARGCGNDFRGRFGAGRSSGGQRNYASGQRTDPLAGEDLVPHFAAQGDPGEGSDGDRSI